jgi:diguanylate cyclase (GGDEF)-like protein
MPLLVSLQLTLYAILWMLCGIALKDQRAAIVQWLGYALTSAAAAALLGWRPDGPVWLTHTGSSAATLLSLILASRGVLLFLGLRPPDRLFLAIAGAAALGFTWVGPQDTDARVAVMAFFNLLVLLGSFSQAATRFQSEFGARVSVAATFPVLALVGMNAYFLLQGLVRGGIDIVGPGAVPVATWVASHDATTGLPNRRAAEQRLQLEWDRSVRYGKPFVVISADVDFFKRINDQHGHAAGDAALIAVASALQNCARETDHVSRFGGEEFLILMPEAQAQADGVTMAERLRQAIAGLALDSPAGEHMALSASFGVSGWLATDSCTDDVLRRADHALYTAKDKGRNCVVLRAD